MTTTPEPGSESDAQFSAERGDAESWVITVAGEVDLDCQDRFEAVVELALAAGAAKLVFDLAGVRFMDSSALVVMLAAAQELGSVEVRAASPVARRLIEVSGLAEVLGIDR